MFKKLSASVFALALVAAAVVPAQAQLEVNGTVGVYITDVGGAADSRFGNTMPSSQFEIVVVTKIDASSCASEFVITELTVAAPGVFKLNTVRANGSQLDLGDNAAGEYVISYAGCLGAGSVEAVRVTYGTFQGDVPADTVIEIRGLQPGDSQPSSFGGQLGWVNPQDEKFIMEPEPWPDGTNIDPTKGPNGVSSAAGVCVINADTVPTGTNTMSSLKARF